MKAADITDDAFLAAVIEVAFIRTELYGPWGIGSSRWDVAAVLAGHPEDVAGSPQDYSNMPDKVVLAKARKLIKRGLVDGCACGCRGDFTVLAPLGDLGDRGEQTAPNRTLK